VADGRRAATAAAAAEAEAAAVRDRAQAAARIMALSAAYEQALAASGCSGAPRAASAQRTLAVC
jgi:hypothetical protein